MAITPCHVSWRTQGPHRVKLEISHEFAALQYNRGPMGLSREQGNPDQTARRAAKFSSDHSMLNLERGRKQNAIAG